MKDEIRVLGIDDGCFDFSTKQVLVIGAVLRGNHELEGVLSCKITKDGADGTKKISGMIKRSKYFCQLRAIVMNGSTLGGFNIVDISTLSRKTKLPVISVFRRKPDDKKILAALSRFSDGKKKFQLFKKGGKIHEFRDIYFQVAGADSAKAKQIIMKTLLKSNVPEPVRAAHLIASGVTTGESTKRV